jgi:hypothetical protein
MRIGRPATRTHPKHCCRATARSRRGGGHSGERAIRPNLAPNSNSLNPHEIRDGPNLCCPSISVATQRRPPTHDAFQPRRGYTLQRAITMVLWLESWRGKTPIVQRGFRKREEGVTAKDRRWEPGCGSGRLRRRWRRPPRAAQGGLGTAKRAEECGAVG